MRQDKRTKKGPNGAAREARRPREAERNRRSADRMTAGRALRVAIFAAAVYTVLLLGHPPLGVDVGQPSPQDFRARVAFTSIDLEQTQAARQQAMHLQPPVFRAAPERWRAAVDRLVEAVRHSQAQAFVPYLPTEAERKQFAAVLPRLAQRADALRQALDALPAERVVAPADLEQPIVADAETNEVVLLDAAGNGQTVPVASLVPLNAAVPPLSGALAPVLEGLPPAEAALAGRVMTALLEPGASLDLERSRENALRAAQAAPTVKKNVEKGRIVLAQGSEVRPQHIEDLKRERQAYWESWGGRSVLLQRSVGLGVLLLIVMAAGVASCLRYRPDLLDRKLQMFSFGVLTLALVGTARLCVTKGITPLWVPVPMMVMIMCLVYDQRFGLGAAVFSALLVRLASPGADRAFLVLLLGGITAALLSGKVRTRGTLIKAALLIGLAQFVAVWGLALMSAHDGALLSWRFWESPYLSDSLAGLANGVLGGFVVSGLLPAIEGVFGVTTDIRLLEWSDPNQPLLQRLLLDAPGTYHHSMVVGSLAADAAEAVGANPLLARVSAYFHDVGKLKKPEYFAENLPPGAHNPHDDLSPTMSTLIITAHPKDGAEMAEEYGVPRPVVDVILQSHGTGVLKYFLNKAQSGETEPEEVQERNFRYRLLKPQGKEAAVVMLCDSVESAARSMSSPSAGQLRNLVHQIILDRLHDGQLDESGLTITDLKRLEDTLVHGLAAVFHNRLRYPGQEKLEREEPEAGPGPRQNGQKEEPAVEGRDQQPADDA